MKLILGSSSPRRQELLSLLHEDFEIIPPHIDETPYKDEDPYEYCCRISREKAKSLIERTSNSAIVITADTTVTLHGAIYGKPTSYAHACEMLSLLSNQTHTVATALSLAITNESSHRIETGICKTEISFKALSQKTVEDYLSKVDYSDKAGSYALQSFSDMIVENVNGSKSNVIGFPVRLFFELVTSTNIFDILF